MTANSAPPNGWRSAISPAPIRSPGPRRHSQSFKRPPVAPLRRRSRHLRQVGTWSDSRSKADRRSVSLRLTNKGKKALASDPFEVLVRAVDTLDAKERTEMHHTLHKELT